MTILAAAGRRRGGSSLGPFPTSAPYNVPTHLTIPTYEGSNQPIHPDVLDFHKEIGTSWNGWRYWMVMTPYPAYNDTWEDPSIVVSNNGIDWQVPAGLTNPLYLPVGAYNNDPDIVYDPASDELVVFYRDYDVWKMARSADGVTWPATPTVAADRIAVSPCVLRNSDGTWRVWTAGGSSTAATAEGPWVDAGANTGLTNVWHLNVVHAPGGGYHMLYHDISTGQKNIKVASSANGTNWTTNATPVLVSGTEQWSLNDLYRPTLTLHEDGDRYRVWYCGNGPDGTKTAWRIGYTEIPLTEWPAII